MIEDYDAMEQQMREMQEAEEELHSAFHPQENSLELEKPLADQELAEGKSEMQRQAAYGTKFQGDIGEGVSLRVATERLGLTPDPRFDQTRQGIDGVYQEGAGKMVVVESKFDERGIRALNGDQMQPEWLERTATKMETPGSTYYTPGNAEIAMDLQEQGVDRVRRLVIATDPASLDVTVYEGQSDHTWKVVDAWSALEFEQPYLMD